MFCSRFSERKAILWGLILIFSYFVPFFILGEDSFIIFWDYLDITPAHIKSAIDLGLLTNQEGNLPVLDGVPLYNLVPVLFPFNIQICLYQILPVYWAIVCNGIFVKIVAFLGMFFLSKKIVGNNMMYALIVAVIFSFIPFYSNLELSAAGVPLLLCCIINLNTPQRIIISYLLIFFFACNSSFVMVGLFVCIIWALYIMYKWIKESQCPKHHIMGLILLGGTYALAIFPMVFDFLFSSKAVSHRVEMVYGLDVLGVIDTCMFSQFNVGSFSAAVVLLLSFVIFAIWGKHDKSRKYYIGSFVVFVVLLLLSTLLIHLPGKIFTSFNFNRLYYLYPTLCFIIFAKALSFMRDKRTLAFVFSFIVLIGVVYYDQEARINIYKLVGKTSANPSFRQFFDTSLFAKIRKDIGENNHYGCKVVSLGMYPAIAQFNGFYTLDSYVTNYPLSYKQRFRKIIEKELQKNDFVREYFDEWGNRCYVFSSEIGLKYWCSKDDNISVNNLEINTELLKDMGCEYIISAVNINNYKDLGLSFVNSYTSPESYWNVRMYKLN